jgi:hypothetical protein
MLWANGVGKDAESVAEGSVLLDFCTGQGWQGPAVFQQSALKCTDRPTVMLSKLLEDLVGAGRFERPTPCAQGRCATRLRYAPTFYSFDSKLLPRAMQRTLTSTGAKP